jgi:hypothetical protein
MMILCIEDTTGEALDSIVLGVVDLDMRRGHIDALGFKYARL